MKKTHFYRYYILFFIVACLFIITFNQIYKTVFAPPPTYSVNVAEVFDSFQNSTTFPIKQFDINRYHFTDNVLDQLNHGDVVAYEVAEQSYFIRKIGDQYFQFGPISTIEDEYQDQSLVVLIFYTALALLILIMLRPLFRDVYHLQNCAVEFGKHPSSQPLTISSNSSVYPLAKALYDMSHQLLEQMKLHKDLASIIAHEVRTPLARMKFVMQKIKPVIAEKDLERLQTDVEALEDLAHNYLEFGINQVTDENYLQPIQCKDIRQEIEKRFAQSATPIEFISNNDTHTFMGHFPQLCLAITNLINNAQRYAKSTIEFSCHKENEYLVISIKDDGPGFTATQISSAAGNEHQGFGLGLYIVKQVMLRHSGKFNISKSHLGGANMSLYLPTKQDKLTY